MKRIFLIGILWLSALAVTYAQQDTKAKKLLDQTTEIYQNAGGVSIHFTGSQNGKLLLDGNRFYLECGGVKSWFDGRTQPMELRKPERRSNRQQSHRRRVTDHQSIHLDFHV